MIWSKSRFGRNCHPISNQLLNDNQSEVMLGLPPVLIEDLGKINCQTKNGGQTLYLLGANGCDLLENDWYRYHGTVDISSCSGINELKESSEFEDFY